MERIIELRHELDAAGLDAGPVTIAWHLQAEGLTAPSTSTIHRILTGAGLVTPEPKKRPKSSLKRFEAAQPNECWQSDFTHWVLADGTDTEVLNWLDDHSRLLLACTVFARVSGDDVVDTFAHTANEHGLPASTLTDNGSVYTSRFTGGKNAYEYLLATLRIIQKNGHPGHPQTQGKIERFHQTLKKWLHRQPAAESLAELQSQLDHFRHIYNEQRPHRALGRSTPRQAYEATLKSSPPATGNLESHYRIRLDRVDKFGKLTLRRAGRLHHLGVGIIHTRKRVLMVIDDLEVTLTEQTTGEILGQYDINPDRNYWPKKQGTPAKGRGSPI